MANDNTEHDPNAPPRIDERGVPLYSRMIPGGLPPNQRPPVRVPKRAEYERGSAQDRLGNRGH
jgi:hypothetical protein